MSDRLPNNPVLALVQKLLDRTRAGQIKWRDASTSFSGDQFRTHVADGLVIISQTSRSVEIDEDVSRHDDGYVVTVLNSSGQTILEYPRFDGDSAFEPLKQLFDEARLSARDGDQVIGGMLEALDR